LAYHLCDIYLEELDKVLASALDEDAAPQNTPIARLLDPFLTLAARTSTNPTLQRVISAVLEPLVQSLAQPQYVESPGHKRRHLLEQDLSVLVEHACLLDPATEKTAGKNALHRGVVRLVFDTASQAESRDSNRRKLYAFWKQHAGDLDDQDKPNAVIRKEVPEAS
jgi:ribosomal RNA-processing protein 1